MAWALHTTLFTVDGEEEIESETTTLDSQSMVEAQMVCLEAAIDQVESLIAEDCINPHVDQYSIEVTSSNPYDPWFDTKEVHLNGKVVAKFKVTNDQPTT